MDYAEGSSDGIYLPMRPLFDAFIYERAQQICWHKQSYKRQVAVMVECLRLHRSNLLPPEMTIEDIIDQIKEWENASLRVSMWHLELEEYERQPEMLALLDAVWQITTGLKFRDVEFEARRTLNSTEPIPEAERSARKMTERWQRPSNFNPLTPREVVLKVVPKVVQGFWQPPPNTNVDMPSQYLTEMTIGLTKNVEHQLVSVLTSMDVQATFSKANRDSMALFIQDTVRQLYFQDVMDEKLSCFAPELLRLISWFAVDAIRQHFEPQPDLFQLADELEDAPLPAEDQDSGLEEVDTSHDDAEDLPRANNDTEDSGCATDNGDDSYALTLDWYVNPLSWRPVGTEVGTFPWYTINGQTDDGDYYAYAGPIRTSSWLPADTDPNTVLWSTVSREINNGIWCAYASEVCTSPWSPLTFTGDVTYPPF